MSDTNPPASTPVPPPPDLGGSDAAPGAPRRRIGMVAGAIGVVVALIAGVVAIATLRGGDSAEAQPLALTFTAGRSETYEITQTMDGSISSDVLGDQPLSMETTQVVTWEVTGVDGDGNATIEVTTTNMSGTVNGIAIPDHGAPTPPIEFVIAPDGRIVSAGGLALGGAGQTQGFGFPGMGQLTPLLPDAGDAVAVGDSWDKDFSQEFPFGEGTIEFTATSTYDRNEDVGGREAAVIVTDMSVPMDFSLEFADVLEAFGDEIPAGVTGVDALRRASATYAGSGEVSQTSWVDLEAEELLKTQSTGSFDIAMTFAGIPGFDGEMTFTGDFTQRMTRR